MTDRHEASLRNHLRANGMVFCSMELLATKEAKESAVTEIFSGTTDASGLSVTGEIDPVSAHILDLLGQIVGMIDDVRRKVDRLTEYAEGRSVSERLVKRYSMFNLSGGGFSLFCDDMLREKDDYRVSIELSSTPLTLAHCLAQVRWCQKTDLRHVPEILKDDPPQFEAGLEITHIREADRERVIHAVFKLQREDLRARRDARDEIAE